MFDAIKRSPRYFGFGAIVIVLFLLLQTSGRASGGKTRPERIDPKQIRSASPGSWTYVYWAYGSRGK
ncbi:MAG: hypothetical protein AAFP86_14205 [Planctomycetota bacterium]